MRKEYDDEDEIPERRHSSGKKKKKFGWVNVLTILLVVVLVVLVGVYAVINHYYSKSNYVSDDKITINKSTEVETESTGLTDEETRTFAEGLMMTLNKYARDIMVQY